MTITNSNFVVKNGLSVNGAITANSTAISFGANTYITNNIVNTGLITVNQSITIGNSTVNISANSTTLILGNTSVNVTINSTTFSGTSNNALYLNGAIASGYQLNSTLNANIAAYLPTYTGTVNGAIFQTGAGYGTATGGHTTNTLIMGIGNTTVNAYVNSSALVINGVLIANSTGANNSFYLGGAAAAAYVNTTGSFSLSGVHTHTANVNLSNNTLINPQISGYSETYYDNGTINSGTVTFNMNNGNFQRLQVNGALTLAISNPPANNIGGFLLLELVNGGANTLTWPAGINWPSGIAPTLTVSGTDYLMLFTRNNGTTWKGNLNQANN